MIFDCLFQSHLITLIFLNAQPRVHTTHKKAQAKTGYYIRKYDDNERIENTAKINEKKEQKELLKWKNAKGLF